MQEEFSITDTWLPYEIHPETPETGVLLKNYFRGMDVEGFFRGLDEKNKARGIRFNHQPLMSNSNLALQAGEYAKDKGKYNAFHSEVFQAYFTECLDIGDRSVLAEIGVSAGIDPAALLKVLEQGQYRQRVLDTGRLAKDRGIKAAPTFIIEDRHTITGAQPLEVFRAAIHELVH